jgi:RNA polymerase sigma-70 factor (ECF subfamily)
MDARKAGAAVNGVEGGGRAAALVEQARARAKAEQDSRAKEKARDLDLVARVLQGDAQAFRQLVERHQKRVFAVAYGVLHDRDEAMDAVQDTFIKVHKKLPEFEGGAAFSTWLYRICVNLCIDKKRAVARRKQVDLDDALATHDGDDSLYADAEIGGRLSGTNPLKNSTDKELGAELGRAVASLSEDHRTVLLLREVEGMSYEEIADTLSIPRGTVMSRLFHARRNMQRLLRPFLGLPDEADGAPTKRAAPSAQRAGSTAGAERSDRVRSEDGADDDRP